MSTTTNPPDILQQFGEALIGFLDGWRERDGLHWDLAYRLSFIEEEPALDPETGRRCARSRRGPQIKLDLTITDTTRADELPLAIYAHDYGLAQQIDTASPETIYIWN